jgi:hypothetical protein
MSKQVQIGERYRDREAFWNEWRVERVYTDPLGVPHAVVASRMDETDRRTIACPTLLDSRRYETVTPDTPPSRLPSIDEIMAAAAARA